MTVQSETTAGRPIAIHEVAWVDAAPGLRAKALWADRHTERRAYLGRIAAGSTLPLHRHLGDELVYVIEGDVSDESGTLTAGQASYRPVGCVHSLWTAQGTTVLIVVTGRTEPVPSADGGPRSVPIDISRLDWVDTVPGVREKLIWSQPGGPRAMRLMRWEPQARLPEHRHLGDALLFGIEGECTDRAGATMPGYLSYWPRDYVHSIRAVHGATMLYYTWGATKTLT